MNKLLVFTLVALLGSAFSALAMDDTPIRPGAISGLDDLEEILPFEAAVLNIGAFEMTVTNAGYFGNAGPGRIGAFFDPCTDLWAPQFEYPSGSGVQYLFQGGLWIGAMVDTGEGLIPRVSVALEGWFASAQPELVPLSPLSLLSSQPGRLYCDDSEMEDPSAIAPMEIIAEFTDTSLVTEMGVVRRHPNDGNHVPLNIKATQRTLGFAAIQYDKFAIVEYTIENIGDLALQDLCVGLFFDGDVGGTVGNQHQDDITGFLGEFNGREVNIAWLADNDGFTLDHSAFESPGVIGVTVLQSPEDAPLGGYNWWVSNSNENLDFGPSLQQEDEDHWTTTYGTPFRDEYKYELLRNGEKDYDQYRVADSDWIATNPQEWVDPLTGETATRDWQVPGHQNALDLANGYDTRFLLSWGPLGEQNGEHRTLAPGRTVTLAFAIVVGDDFHDESNPQTGETIDPTLFNFENLVASAERARWVYSDMLTNAPPAPPVQMTLYAGFSGTVLAWPQLINMPDAAYNVYRFDPAVDQEWPTTPLNANPIPGTRFVDRNADPSQPVEYRLQAVRHDTLLSNFSGIWSVPDDFIAPTAELEGEAPAESSFLVHPNPFNAVTTVSVRLTETQEVGVSLYNLLGREVLSLPLTLRAAGTHRLTLNGGDLPSGLYFVRVQLGSNMQYRKVMLLK